MYKPAIGLEIHIELNTKSKMFCDCANGPDEKRPNVNICPVCLGHPGVLPIINKEAVKKTIKVGLALNCQIAEHSKFDRKNYFYPDLPKNYQISQLYVPFCRAGFLKIDNPEAEQVRYGVSKKIRIREVHLEEDTGKLIHPPGADYSLVDFNRAGIPLMELVTEPDINSAKEAREFAQELHLIMHYLNVSDADMEKGQMRVEVNISLSKNLPAGGGELGTKVEIKNLNSFRSVERGIEYEIKRQSGVLESGREVVQETRGWDDVKGETLSQREKEEAHDYRYFPEPDLPPLRFTEKEINDIGAEIPELPQQKRERLEREYQLDEKISEIFVYNKDLGEYFEKVIKIIRNFEPPVPKKELPGIIKRAVNYLITDLQGLMRKNKITTMPQPEVFARFILSIPEDKISSRGAKIVLEEMVRKGGDPSQIIKERGLEQISDTGELEKIIKEAIEDNPKVVEDFKSGKENALQYLVGQIMALTEGKANPKIVNDLLNEILTKSK